MKRHLVYILVTGWMLYVFGMLAAAALGDERPATVGQQIKAGGQVVYTFTTPGVERVEVPGEDHVYTVTPAAPVPPDPVPEPTPIPEPPPTAGIRVPPGADVTASIRTGGTFLLERGGTYRGPVNVSKDGTTIAYYGHPTFAAPRITGGLTANGRSRLSVQGIHFDGSGKSTSGMDLLNVSEVEILDCRVVGFGGMGITVQGYGGKRCRNVTVRGCLIADNWPATGKHVSGLFASYTDGLWIAESVFDTNGWKPGVKNATIFNHGAYLHATNGPATVSDCVFRNNASHGLQQRCGGPSLRNLFVDNAIHQSYGLVNGAPCFPGGVSGEIRGSVYIGGRDIAGSKRGWCLELSNIRKVIVSDLLMAHDTQNNNVAITVQRCERVENPSQLVGIIDLTIRNAYVWDWQRGAIRVTLGTPKLERVGVAPPVATDLRKALGQNFEQRASANPRTAAKDGVAACWAAAGM